jgi:uncharacterized protein
MTGALSYIEIGASDAAKTRDFFSALFGWTFNAMGEQGGGWFQLPGMMAGLHGGNPEPQIYPFFEVPDLLIAVETVRKLGGTAEEPGPQEEGFGRFSNCQDPNGIRFGLHQKG